MPTAKLSDARPIATQSLESAEPKSQTTAATAHEWSSTQMNLPAEIARTVLAFAESIPPDKVVPKEEGQDEPHITVLYGIDPGDAGPVKTALAGASPVRIKLGKMSIFENDDADVLKVDVDSPEIEAMNRKLREEVPHVEKQIEYVPHLTVAYLKPGDGAEYVGKAITGVTGKRMRLAVVQFSSKNGKTEDIALDESGQSRPSGVNSVAGPAKAEVPQSPSQPAVGRAGASTQQQVQEQSR